MRKVFIAGPRVVKVLPSKVSARIASITSKGFTVLVGDAYGVDRLVQEALALEEYKNVIVYATEGKVRNNVGKWSVKAVPADTGARGFEFYAYKDKQMALDADYGFMIWNGESRGTLNNMINLSSAGKKVLVYLLQAQNFYCLHDRDEVKRFCKACGDKTEQTFDRLIRSRVR